MEVRIDETRVGYTVEINGEQWVISKHLEGISELTNMAGDEVRWMEDERIVKVVRL